MHRDTKSLSALVSSARIAALGAAVLLFQSTGYAAPLNLVPDAPPGQQANGDVNTQSSTFRYALIDGSTGSITANGEPANFHSYTDPNQFATGTTALSVTIDRSGHVLGGTLSIDGEIDDADGNPVFLGSLLTGNVVKFGFQDPPIDTSPSGNATGIFEFVVQVTGGALTGPYYTLNGYAGVILSSFNSLNDPKFTGTFDAPFGNRNTGAYSDTFPLNNYSIPEPSSLVLLGLGALTIGWRIRRRRLATTS
jgi:hypothetical protein